MDDLFGSFDSISLLLFVELFLSVVVRAMELRQ